MASQTSSGDSSVPATAYNPDPNTLIVVVTLEDPTHRIKTQVEAFQGKYDHDGPGSADSKYDFSVLTW